MNQSQKIYKIANQAIKCDLSLTNTLSMVKYVYTNPDYYEDSEFVRNNLQEVIENVKQLYKK